MTKRWFCPQERRFWGLPQPSLRPMPKGIGWPCREEESGRLSWDSGNHVAFDEDHDLARWIHLALLIPRAEGACHEILTGIDRDGNPATQDFDESATELNQRAEKKKFNTASELGSDFTEFEPDDNDGGSLF